MVLTNEVGLMVLNSQEMKDLAEAADRFSSEEEGAFTIDDTCHLCTVAEVAHTEVTALRAIVFELATISCSLGRPAGTDCGKCLPCRARAHKEAVGKADENVNEFGRRK